MSQIGFYFDQNKCAGCKTCQVACKDKSRLEAGVMPRMVDTYQIGSYPSVNMYHFSHACNHCTEPACVANCPTGAMQKSEEDGTVFNDHAACIGCGTCVSACPYGAPAVDEVTSLSWKCDGCRELRAAGYAPACVEACPFRALDFGDVEELTEKYGEASVVRFTPIQKDEGTGSNTLINPRTFACEKAGEMIIL